MPQQDRKLDKNFLLRVLGDENSTSDLLATLITTAPEPLAEWLNIRPESLTVKREVVFANGSRIDLQVLSGDTPVALLELKISASAHGNQFNKYDDAVKDLGSVSENLWCLAPMQASPTFLLKHPQWKYKSLNDFLSLWDNDSVDPNTRWFASSLSESFRVWQSLGSQDFTAMMPLPVVQIQLHTTRTRILELMQERSTKLGLHLEQYYLSSSTTVNGPNPAVYIGRQVETGDNSWAWVDARAQRFTGKNDATEIRGTATGTWQIRLGIDCVDSEISAKDDAESLTAKEIKERQADLALKHITQLAPKIEFTVVNDRFSFPEEYQAWAKWDGYKNNSDETYRDLHSRQRFLMFQINVLSLNPSEFAKLLVDLLDFVHEKVIQTES